MEMLQSVLGKIDQYQLYILLGWFFLLTLLLLLVLLRQRRMRKLENVVSAHFTNIRNKLEESVTQQQSTVRESLATFENQLKQVLGNQQKLGTESTGVTGRLEDIGNNLRESFFQLRQMLKAGAQGEQLAAPIKEVRERVEELTDELAWTNNWFEDVKALEAAVTNLIGPAKMRKLIDKERTASQAAGEELIKKSGL